ncbi:glycosyltransferase [Vibrio sp. 1CM23M]|uniref:glycosyltransferase family 2 protein n=1 Tax=Vibrio sp. 1CM23M TaxID=2929164 RepID=UPI0020BEAA6C|nr:glycosyltransferase [Vibrio sp. 1CM23M]MCK8073694.1 glycosyltransferase [Vibrio sp. 1CM23M]
MKVSILIPCYNASKYIKGCIDSLLLQSMGDFEIVIVDDGSTDSSLEIIKSYSDKRIKLIDLEKNVGITNALNVGLRYCEGQFIARMDADDIALPYRLSKQVDYLEKHPDYIAVGSSIINFDEFGNESLIPYPESNMDIISNLFLFERTICHPSVMFRRSIVTNSKLEYSKKYIHCEDLYFWYQLSKLGKLHNIQEPLIKYYRHTEQISSKYSDVQLYNTERLLFDIYKDSDIEISKFTIRKLTKPSTANFINDSDIIDIKRHLTDLHISKEIVESTIRFKSMKFSTNFGKLAILKAIAKFVLFKRIGVLERANLLFCFLKLKRVKNG